MVHDVLAGWIERSRRIVWVGTLSQAKMPRGEVSEQGEGGTVAGLDLDVGQSATRSMLVTPEHVEDRFLAEEET
jgi:hypothetical protein